MQAYSEWVKEHRNEDLSPLGFESIQQEASRSTALAIASALAADGQHTIAQTVCEWINVKSPERTLEPRKAFEREFDASSGQQTGV